MELNEKGEIIQEETKKKERLMGKLLNKQKQVEKPVEETKEEVKQVSEQNSGEDSKQQIIKLAFTYLSYEELTELAKIKVAELEKENLVLASILKEKVLQIQDKED